MTPFNTSEFPHQSFAWSTALAHCVQFTVQEPTGMAAHRNQVEAFIFARVNFIELVAVKKTVMLAVRG
jgi:hypothetical protein